MFSPRPRGRSLGAHCVWPLSLLLSAAMQVGCGSSSPNDRVVEAGRSLVKAFKAGDHRAVCRQLTVAGQASVVAAAESRDKRSVDVSECVAASRFLLDGTPAVGRNSLDTSGAPTDVDVTGDGAKVSWEKCCSFRLEEVGGDYRVSDARDLGLYFDIAGAGAGAGGGSPTAAPKAATAGLIRENLRESARQFPDQDFAGHVSDIAADGPRVTLITDLPGGDSLTAGVCRAAAGGEDDPVANLPGTAQLLIKTTDNMTLDCADIVLAP